MIEQNRECSRNLIWLVIPLLLSICFMFFACAHQSPEYNEKEYSLDQLDKAPRVIQSELPMYPLSAKSRGIRARVMISCIVDKEGVPRNIEVVECDPEDALDVFGPPAIKALKKWRFNPGEIRGKPVVSRVMLNLYFELAPQNL